LKLAELAHRLGCRLDGDGAIEITSVAGIERAGPADVTFLANPRYLPALQRTRASAVILDERAPDAPCAMLRTATPYVAFADALALFGPDDRPAPGVHPDARLAEGVELGTGVSIGPFCWIGPGARIGARTVLHSHVAVGPGAVVGDDCLVHAHVSIRERVTIGHRVVLQNGVVIGSDGFGFATRPDGVHQKVPQLGGVVIEDDVEVGANTTIDRPPVGETRIGAGTKIDNLVQVAHGVAVGRRVLLAAQVGIAGSTTIGDGVILAGQVGVAGHVTIGAGTRATAQTGIPSSVEPGSFVSGYPAIDNRDWLKASAVFRRLPEMKRMIGALERRLAELEAHLAERPTTDAG
jgi:UDP-3-O-[3-hydroxymyristoyl] glucosamine N-acyltransferase